MTANNNQNETRNGDWFENNGIISYHPKEAKFVKFERKNTQHSLCSGNRNLKGIDWIIENKTSMEYGLGIEYKCKNKFNDYQYSVGGKVKDRELPLDAAIRECKEEMGLDIPSEHFKLICKEQIIDNSYKSINEKNRYTVYTYFVNGDVAFFDEISSSNKRKECNIENRADNYGERVVTYICFKYINSYKIALNKIPKDAVLEEFIEGIIVFGIKNIREITPILIDYKQCIYRSDMEKNKQTLTVTDEELEQFKRYKKYSAIVEHDRNFIREQRIMEDYNKRSYIDNRGGYIDNRGGYINNRGGYIDNRGGYIDNRGGYIDNEEGYINYEGDKWNNYGRELRNNLERTRRNNYRKSRWGNNERNGRKRRNNRRKRRKRRNRGKNWD